MKGQETSPHIPKLIVRNRSVRRGQFAYEDREWLRARYESGLDFREIAAEANCSLRTIARWFRIHGLETRPKGHKRPGVRPVNAPTCECGRPKSHGKQRCWDCRNKSFRGVGNPNWQGLGDALALVRQFVADHWRLAVFERDAYRCQRCGNTSGGNLNAHHVVSLSALVRRKRDEWEPELMTAEQRAVFAERLIVDCEVMDLANGITLCEGCHREVHRGKGTYVYAAVQGQRTVVVASGAWSRLPRTSTAFSTPTSPASCSTSRASRSPTT